MNVIQYQTSIILLHQSEYYNDSSQSSQKQDRSNKDRNNTLLNIKIF